MRLKYENWFSWPMWVNSHHLNHRLEVKVKLISRLWTVEPVRKQTPNLHKWLFPAERAKENNTSFSWGTGFWNMTRGGVENPPKGDFHYRRRKGKQNGGRGFEGKSESKAGRESKMGFESKRGTTSESLKWRSQQNFTWRNFPLTSTKIGEILVSNRLQNANYMWRQKIF